MEHPAYPAAIAGLRFRRRSRLPHLARERRARLRIPVQPAAHDRHRHRPVDVESVDPSTTASRPTCRRTDQPDNQQTWRRARASCCARSGPTTRPPTTPLTLDILIAPKTARAEDMAQLVSSVIAGVPQMVREGRMQEQTSTNIVPFLMNISKNVDCTRMPTHVILASDGVEDSQVADLRTPQARLPAPQGAPFAGCEELDDLRHRPRPDSAARHRTPARRMAGWVQRGRLPTLRRPQRLVNPSASESPRGRHAVRAQGPKRRRLIALRQPPPARICDQAMMPIARHRQTQQRLQQAMHMRRRE